LCPYTPPMDGSLGADHIQIYWVGGILYRDYNYDNWDTFNYCGELANRTRWKASPELYPSGPV